MCSNDNVIGENSFFDIHTNNLREDVTSRKSFTPNRFRQIVASLALLNNMSANSSLESILSTCYVQRRCIPIPNAAI